MSEERSRPILSGTADTDYERYLRTDELLALQKTPGEVVHRDEHLFQAVHQSSELWLKLACTELEEATALLAVDGVYAATRLVRRAGDCIELITTQLHMLEHLSPVDYAVVRTALGHGAGFDSPGFRRVHKSSPALGEAFDALLKRRGADLLSIDGAGFELEDLFQLAEQMITWDERVILWRFHHLKVVERIIGGNVIGTQGTPVEVLGRLVHNLFYPELWRVRNELTALSQED
jgi:tryptophan 2,3-dioxygenase